MKKWFTMLAATLLVFSSYIGQSFAAQQKMERQQYDLQADYTNQSTIAQEFEPNDSFEQANDIQLNSTVSGTLETGGESDFYKFDVTEKGYLFWKGSEINELKEIAGAVYDANYNLVDGNYITKGTRVLGDMFTFQPGTYYLKVNNYNYWGSPINYSFDITFTPADITRIAGADRYDTAVQLAYATLGGSMQPEIILATGENFPDALAAAPLAYLGERTLLLTKRNELPESVKSFIKNTSAKKVTIIGGTGAVSQGVEDYLGKTLGLEVTRIAGKDRFETAAKIAESSTFSWYKESAIVVNGRSFADALCAAPITAGHPAPILLTDTNSMPAVTANKVKEYQNTFVIGGTGVVSDAVFKQLPKPTRIAGQNRYETSIAVAKYFIEKKWYDSDSAFVTTGVNFPDALAASSVSGYSKQPIILTKPNTLEPITKNFFESYNVLWYTIMGGTGAVSQEVEQSLWALIK